MPRDEIIWEKASDRELLLPARPPCALETVAPGIGIDF